VSGRTAEDPATASDPQQGFVVTQAGRLVIDGAGGDAWDIMLLDDAAPTVTLTGPIEADASGEMSQPFSATDDYGVVAGIATIALDLASLDRRYGLGAPPDLRDAVVLDLPMPFSGDRADFEDLLIDDFSEHPWANLPVTVTLQVEGAGPDWYQHYRTCGLARQAVFPARRARRDRTAPRYFVGEGKRTARRTGVARRVAPPR